MAEMQLQVMDENTGTKLWLISRKTLYHGKLAACKRDKVEFKSKGIFIK